METVIEFVVLDSAAKAKHRKDIEAIMSLCDSDFVPPLSSRRGTTQSDLSGKASPGSGIGAYCDEMMKQEVLAAVSESRILGFVSYRENMVSGDIGEDTLPNIYISTLLLHPDSRGMHLTARMYDHIFNTLYPERSIFTRTWSTNLAHIKILAGFDFCEMKRIKNDRGEGIDTVYFKLER
ncbi:MAG: hypothetical protein IIV97_03730 [Oscillospiraceae bacterium]|nr:hypothetical protein [Oscillospiraceae bacterium]